jgi:hypothetical protein
MITEKDYLEAKKIVQEYESKHLYISAVICSHEKTIKHMMTGIRYCANPKCKKILAIE